MYKTRLTLAALTMILLFGTFAYARPIIYDNGGPNQANGNEMTEWVQTEEFSLATANTVTDIHFWDVEAQGAYTGSISWWITGDVGGNPDWSNIIGSGSVSPTHTFTGNSLFFGDEFSNDWTIPGVALAGGTEYHLALHNGSLDITTRNNFYWETTGNVDAQTGRECNLQNGACFGSWFDNGQEHAFNLTGGTVPEPGTLLLFGSSVVGIAGMLRRKLF